MSTYYTACVNEYELSKLTDCSKLKGCPGFNELLSTMMCREKLMDTTGVYAMQSTSLLKVPEFLDLKPFKDFYEVLKRKNKNVKGYEIYQENEKDNILEVKILTSVDSELGSEIYMLDGNWDFVDNRMSQTDKDLFSRCIDVVVGCEYPISLFKYSALNVDLCPVKKKETKRFKTPRLAISYTGDNMFPSKYGEGYAILYIDGYESVDV